MNINIKDIARKATVLSDLMTGREQIKTKDIINDYPSGITITRFDMVAIPDKKGRPTVYPCCIFKEDTTKYFNGGYVLSKIFDSIIVQFEGDVEKANKALAEQGGLMVKFTSTTTKEGNNLTAIEIM